MYSEEPTMTQDDQGEEDKRATPVSSGLRPYIVYRNPEYDPVRCVLQAQGRPLLLKTTKDS
jgi:hypothetical protein